MYEKLLKKINEFDKITIFRHVRPDGDCTFSQLALYTFLNDNFKNKQIKCCGNEKYEFGGKYENVKDSFIVDSLAIVVDTATDVRADDFRFLASKYIIKIDHHPPVQNYGDLNIVEPERSSTCELLAKILFSKPFAKYKISKKVCKYLYCGIVTDTMNFVTANTTANTLAIASKLVDLGDLEVSNIIEYLFDINLDTFKKVTEIRKHLVVDKGLGYIKLSKKELNKIGIDPIEAKNHIDEIGHIHELNIWAFAVENNGAWDCSMRSKKPYIINKIASKYRGGGHENACAVKHVTALEMDSILSELAKISQK